MLAVGRMEPLEIPERHEPWLHFHERLPWPMELSSRVDILGPGDSFRNLEHRLRMIRSQQLDYAEHGIDAPPELERLAKRALVIGDEMTTGLPVDSARAHGWHRIAVGGAHPRGVPGTGPPAHPALLARAAHLAAAPEEPGLAGPRVHPRRADRQHRLPAPDAGQAARRRAAAGRVHRRRPARRPDRAHRRHLPPAGLPRPALPDGGARALRPRACSSPSPAVASRRCIGALGYLAARRGVQVTLLDPSGPLARLCPMPELRPYSRVLNLTGSEQGTLAPYALIPTPLRTRVRARRRPATASSRSRSPTPGPSAGCWCRTSARCWCRRRSPARRPPRRCCATPCARCRPRRRPPWTTWSPACRAWTTTTRQGAGQPAAGHRRDAAGAAVLRLARRSTCSAPTPR